MFKGKELRYEVAYYFSRFSTASFIKPIYSIYLAKLNIDVSSIVLVSNIHLVQVIVLTPLVSYFISDKVSRKLSWLLALIFFKIGLAIYVFARGLKDVVLAELIYNIGAVFRASNPEIMAYTALKRVNEKKVTQVLMGGELISLITMGLFSISGGLMATYDLRLPFIALISTLLLIFIVTFILGEDVRDFQGRRSIDVKDIVILRHRLTSILPALITLLAISLTYAMTSPLISLLLYEQYGLSFFSIGLVYAIIGFATYMLLRTTLKNIVSDAYSEAVMPLSIITCTLIAFMLFSGSIIASIMAFLMLTLLPRVARPIIFVYLQGFIEERLRATVNSLISSIVSVMTFILIVIGNLLKLTIEGILTYVIAINAILLIIALLPRRS